MATASNVATIAQAGKFLSFRLGSEEYGLEILKVQEIVGDHRPDAGSPRSGLRPRAARTAGPGRPGGRFAA